MSFRHPFPKTETTETNNKYGACQTWVHPGYLLVSPKPVTESWHRFDSKLEAETYIALRQVVPDSGILRQHKVLIKPTSANYKSLHWRCDFYIPRMGLYIESKGEILREFKLQLQMLDFHNPQVYQDLMIVTSSGKPVDRNKGSITVSQLRRLFKEHWRHLFI
ncbi:MAG TPA: hypothetical protein V6C65_18875 [Allocoleopsis sp.]